MSDLEKGMVVGAFAMLVAIILFALFAGCESVGEVNAPEMRKVEDGPPGRPPLPEGWRSEGDLWINDITKDTI